jgi:RHS repeat-associated protein
MEFLYDQNGAPFAMIYNGVPYYYVLNLQGDVVRLVNGEGVSFGIYRYDAWGNILYESTNEYIQNNPLRYRGYYYDTDTGFYYLQSRYYDPQLGRLINADQFASTGQGFLGYNMFAYCRNNPTSRVDVSGRADISAVEESFDDDVDVGPNDKEVGGGVACGGNDAPVGASDGSGAGPNGYEISIGPNGISAVPNPNNEKTETHHIVERCQIRKSGFAQVDIQGNSNLISLPYDLHRKISGYYSSKQGYSGNMIVRDWLAGQSYEFQYNFGMEQIAEIWGELYG